MEMERGTIQVQEQSAEHRAKMWKVRTLQQLDCGFKQLLDMYNIHFYHLWTEGKHSYVKV